MAGLIVFEGIDGSGKSTHSKLFVDYLTNNNIKAVWHCEPTNGVIGKLIRDAFVGKTNLHHTTIANLFAADRYEHITNAIDGILKLIADGYWVICDRYLLSSYAYQGSILDRKWIQAINAKNEALLWPNATFYIDLHPENAMKRIIANREQVELFETNEHLTKVHQTYQLAIEALNPTQKKSVINIDGNQSIEVIQKLIQQKFEAFFL